MNTGQYSGTITHVFGHRFVLRTGQGDVLADLSPKGLEQIALRLNDKVTIEGEMKPSELKVARLTRAEDTVRIEHKARPHKEHGPQWIRQLRWLPARPPGLRSLAAAPQTKAFRVAGAKKWRLHRIAHRTRWAHSQDETGWPRRSEMV